MKESIFSAKAVLDERRKHERVEINFAAQVYVADEKGKRVGVLRQIGRGGFMMEPEKEFKQGKKYKFQLLDRSENIKVAIKALVLYSDMRRTGLQFEDLNVDSAVDIGILIGKYYQNESVIA